ncbi:MAG: thiosulfate oxidation carrier protein SoxY [Methylophilales bacterium]|nr:thiosulfate oxidation carrier protein SoxY [Methylophilales bacterium]
MITRRNLLKSAAALLALVPLRVVAAVWNKVAFAATKPEAALQGLGISQPQPSSEIDLVAPDFAENGAIVQIEVESHIPNTEAIAILADKNPTSLIANFMFSNGGIPKLITRVKLAETCELKVIVKVGDRYYEASKNIQVAVGGCG